MIILHISSAFDKLWSDPLQREREFETQTVHIGLLPHRHSVLASQCCIPQCTWLYKEELSQPCHPSNICVNCCTLGAYLSWRKSHIKEMW
jgi:hypothetical protein